LGVLLLREERGGEERRTREERECVKWAGKGREGQIKEGWELGKVDKATPS